MDMISTREAYGKALERLGYIYKDIVVLEADISKSTRTCYFRHRHPDRFFNVGIAEQNMLCIASGMATAGKIPFANTYGVFATMRACEQIRTSICYPRLNVKIAASHGGLTSGNDGVTHQAIEDMGIMRTIPNMTVIMPADAIATEALVHSLVEYKGPVYLRLTRDALPVIYESGEEFQIGKAKVLKEGRDVTIAAIGDMVSKALETVEDLKGWGIDPEVIDVHTLKPLDYWTINRSIAKTGCIVTVEDHNIINGLGSAVAEYICENHLVPLKRVGLRDTFAESGEYEKLIVKYGLSSEHIKKAVLEVIRKKEQR